MAQLELLQEDYKRRKREWDKLKWKSKFR